MLQTLLYIPARVFGIPVFGIGLLLAVWLFFGVGLLIWQGLRRGWNADTWSYVPLVAIVAVAIAWILPALREEAGLPIRSYGVMLLVAVLAATGLAMRRARRVGVDPDLILTLIFWMFVSGIVGARTFYVVEYWPQFQHARAWDTLVAVINVAKGGLVVYGSLLGGTLGLIVFVVRSRLRLLAILDLMIPSVVLGMAIGRIGCLLNGCCFGGACDLPWAVTFPWNSPPHQHQVEHGEVFLHGLKFRTGPDGAVVIAEVERNSPASRAGLAPGQTIVGVGRVLVDRSADVEHLLLELHNPGVTVSIATTDPPARHTWTLAGQPPRSLAVHPTQVYSAINEFLLCLLLLAYDAFRRRDGELFALFLTLYPLARFLIEMLRTDEGPALGTPFTISQIVSLLLLILAAGFWWYIIRRPRGVTLQPVER